MARKTIKYLKLQFRGIDLLDVSQQRVIPSYCSTQSAPECKFPFLYLKTREGQTMCYQCMVYEHILQNHPLLDVTKI